MALKIKDKMWCATSALLVLTLAACTNAEIRATRIGSVNANPLQQQLYLQYGELAFRKQTEGNSASARHFELKAARAAAGRDVVSDRPDNPDALADFVRLHFAISDGTAVPAIRARAQVMFDCWLEEQEQNLDRDDIQACRQEFERALALLTGTLAMKANPS
ncbi:MAG: hypothetical protein JJ900_02870 [Rhodospirillales bacterium]|nr:hypothetical protein [Rhodospirillales bacterium]MBO6785766.1 hypothetical protein [Rhodospirillales bacterium]